MRGALASTSGMRCWYLSLEVGGRFLQKSLDCSYGTVSGDGAGFGVATYKTLTSEKVGLEKIAGPLFLQSGRARWKGQQKKNLCVHTRPRLSPSQLPWGSERLKNHRRRWLQRRRTERGHVVTDLRGHRICQRGGPGHLRSRSVGVS